MDRFELRERVEQLYEAFVRALDCDLLEELPPLFVDDGSYRLVSMENHRRGLPLATMRFDSRGMLQDKVFALRNTAMYIPRTQRHVISMLNVADSTETSVHVRAAFAVFETLPEEPTRVLTSGEYDDRLVWDDDNLLFAAKTTIYDSDLVRNSLVLPL